MSAELLPIAAGLTSGSLIGYLRPSLRFPVGIACAVAFGFLATVVSGEFRVSWAYLLVDIPLVAVSALFAFTTMRWMAQRRSGAGVEPTKPGAFE